MATLTDALSQMNTLEDLAQKDTFVHRCHPLLKIILTLFYIVAVVSFSQYDLAGILVMASFPIVIMPLAEVPYKPLLKRWLVALPFVIFAGISQVLFHKEIVFFLGNIGVSFGVLALVCLVLKTLLTVMAVLILMATTPMSSLTNALISLHVPRVFITQFSMTYRYVSLLIGEARGMYTAYRLRSSQKKGIHFSHVGAFIGQLLLRSMDKAERVFYAMKCRGYGVKETRFPKRRVGVLPICVTVVICAMILAIRLMPTNQWFGYWF